VVGCGWLWLAAATRHPEVRLEKEFVANLPTLTSDEAGKMAPNVWWRVVLGVRKSGLNGSRN
jgi:hypothetical protein